MCSKGPNNTILAKEESRTGSPVTQMFVKVVFGPPTMQLSVKVVCFSVVGWGKLGYFHASRLNRYRQ